MYGHTVRGKHLLVGGEFSICNRLHPDI
jgi:hypothetical protein